MYAEPAYQSTVVPGHYADYWQGNANAQSGSTIPGRVVPDVAMLGDPNLGFLMGQTQDFSAYANPAAMTSRATPTGSGSTGSAARASPRPCSRG